MDTKNTDSTNVKETSSANRSVNVDVPNSNIRESDNAGGTDVRTIDMSGTNVPNATNAKSDAERARDIRENTTRTVDTSVPNPHAVKGADNAENLNEEEAKARQASSKVPQVKVRLTGTHTHEGVSFDEGDVIEVDEQSAKYITETADKGVRV